MIQSALDKINDQIKDKKSGTLEYAVGDLLKTLCERDEAAAELVSQDLDNKDMTIEKCAQYFSKSAREKATHDGYYMSDKEAEELIKKFYGIAAAAQTKQVNLSLSDLL